MTHNKRWKLVREPFSAQPVMMFLAMVAFSMQNGSGEVRAMPLLAENSQVSLAPGTLPRSIPHEELQKIRPDLAGMIDSLVNQTITAGITEGAETLISRIASEGDTALPALEWFLRFHPILPVREAAARTLAETGTSSAVRTLLSALIEETDGEIRRVLASSLHAIRETNVSEELINAVIYTQDIVLLSAIRDALGRVADAYTTQAIVTVYNRGQVSGLEGWQEANLLGVLVRIRSAEAVPTLRAILLTPENDDTIRAQAGMSLGAIGNREAVEALAEAVEEYGLLGSLRNVIIESLGSVRNKDSLNKLLALLDTSVIPEIRYAAAMALANTPSEENVIALKSAASRETTEFVRLAIEKLVEQLSREDHSH